ncbi:MAG: LuxR family transcriptional regulator [Leptolyngbyaceae cyanobacterium SL_5_9]|nr:LuxR family transcriptional regulator [Leptolyngbyaceae cyanobacterium SL_5_9]NJO73858.1 LuxR family transcriptional regulator [Leptolyngbyaceae cyanobacterium RM1_406_9]
MTSSLKFLFEAINQTQTEWEMRSQIAAKIGEYFAATRWGIFFFDQLPLADRNLQKALRIGLSVKHNPVVRYLVERHAPVHETLVTTPKDWSIICPRPDHWHVMAGPIVSQGQLVGAVGCTREKLKPAFDTKDLADMGAICLHLSVWITAARSQSLPKLVEAKFCKTDLRCKAPKDCLTPRELQIAELVALGRTNAEIGSELWITENSVKQALKRMFRKLEVSSRAEMVAQFFSNQRT